MTAWKNKIQTLGVGTELGTLLHSLGFRESAGCGCRLQSAEMNVRGIDWCEQNIDNLTRRIAYKVKRKVPFKRTAAKLLIRKSIKRARIKMENGRSYRQFFSRVYCINLNRREDRWKQFQSQVPTDWPFETIQRVEAIDGKKVPNPVWWRQGGGAWGCYRSHLRILENALNRGLPSYLVFEDDAFFCEDFVNKAKAYLDAIPTKEGLIYFGGQHLFVGKNPPIKINDLVYKPYNVNRTHAFGVVGREFMKTLYKHLTTDDWKKGNHVDHHLGRFCQRRKDPVYAPSEWLVGQAGGKSNIAGRQFPDRVWTPAQRVGIDDPTQKPFVAVLGLHSSGSSCLAGVLYHLGIHLGNSLTGYYGNNPEKSCGFEAVGLKNICESAIPFPDTEYAMKRGQIWKRLNNWINQRRKEASKKGTIAAGKYPQLCRLGAQLINICGTNLRLVVSDRPIEESIESIQKRCPKMDREKLARHQQWLQSGKEFLVSSVDPTSVIRVSYPELLETPHKVIHEVISFLGITPGDTQVEKALGWVSPEKRHVIHQ